MHGLNTQLTVRGAENPNSGIPNVLLAHMKSIRIYEKDTPGKILLQRAALLWCTLGKKKKKKSVSGVGSFH